MAIARRLLLYGGAAAAVAPMLMRPEGGYAQARLPLPAGLFRLGVASGDPLPDGIVLWTRLAPTAGMPARPVDVQWEIAADERFRHDRHSGAEVARPELAHSVHADVRGLRPGAEYFYRFRAGGQISRVGRTRTAPQSTRALRFAFASCQNYQDGFYTAYRHLAEEDVAFVAFLGDYIYEYKRNPHAVRQHEGTGEARTLGQYRDRYATYHADPGLQAVHAAFPWIVALDDHEVDGNWADEHPPEPDAGFRARRIAAFQAYYEHMPLRRSSLPRGLDMQLYRRLRFGSLIDLHVLDTRQYRSAQPRKTARADDPALTMTGLSQEKWLTDGLRAGGVRWNLLANQVMWAANDRTAGFRQSYDFDNWDGYHAQRRRLLQVLGDRRVANPVVLTGDRHATWVCDLRPDFEDPSTPAAGAEITGTSITSGGDEDARAFHALFDPIMRESPHWRYIDNRKGYVVCDVTEERLEASLRVVDKVSARVAPVRTAARFTVEAGRRGIAEVRRSGE